MRRVLRVQHHAAHFHGRQHAAHRARLEQAGEAGDDASAQIRLETGGDAAPFLLDESRPDLCLIVGRLRQFVEQRFARRATLALCDHTVEPGRLLFFLPGFVGIAHAGLPPVLNGFGEMRWGDVVAAGQIGHAARQLEHAVIGACRQIQSGDRLLEQRFPGGIRSAELFDFLCAEPGIGLALPRHLTCTRRLHAVAYDVAGLTCAGLHQFVLRQRGHVDLDVDAVEQRPGNACAVARDLVRRVAAGLGRVTEIAAGTGVHRCDQLEAGGEIGLPRRTRNRDAAGLQRLAQHFQHLPRKLRQFVEEQHAVVRQRDFARPRVAAAAHQRHRRGGVVRCAEGTALPVFVPKAAVERSDRGCFQRFGFLHRRQDARKTCGQHRLAGAGGACHQHRVAAGGGDFERAPGGGLALDVGKVGIVG